MRITDNALYGKSNRHIIRQVIAPVLHFLCVAVDIQ